MKSLLHDLTALKKLNAEQGEIVKAKNAEFLCFSLCSWISLVLLVQYGLFIIRQAVIK